MEPTMSKSEVERFVADIKTSAKLQEAVAGSAGADTASLVAIARTHGYDVTNEDVRNHIRTKKPELTEQELDAVAGGVYSQMGFNFGIKS
jgi:predicted ribosomally synthesized peptide with nif11-like leader